MIPVVHTFLEVLLLIMTVFFGRTGWLMADHIWSKSTDTAKTCITVALFILFVLITLGVAYHG